MMTNIGNDEGLIKVGELWVHYYKIYTLMNRWKQSQLGDGY